MTHPAVIEARERLLERDGWILDLQKEITSIPAPPYGETARGERMMALFRELGWETVSRDEAGNILAAPPNGPNPDRPLILSAHLDTVFPPETDVTPREKDGRILAPGIADDGRGLAALVALAWVITTVALPGLPPILYVATVGEEGFGNLRGVRHLFREGGPGSRARGFISLDGVGMDQVINEGIGSTRVRIQVSGPGGHSWTDWGQPNPIHAAGRIISALGALSLPSDPRTTATVARFGGGTSINAIPEEAWLDLDLRSQSQEELRALEARLLEICDAEVGTPGTDGGLQVEMKDLGRRPAGATAPDDPLVQAALKASRDLGVEPALKASSTDANLPMAQGIPAITLGTGGRAGGIHTLREWYSNEGGPEGILRALLTLLYLGAADSG